jgi:methylmalonyl-CoA mutase
MMTANKPTSEPLSFVGDFPHATQSDWRKLVDAALKGAPFSRLQSRTYDGLTIEPLYEPAPGARALAGRPPGTAWTVVQRVDHPDPVAANAQARDDLQNGATGLVLVFAGSVSANGYGLAASVPLARLLDGIDLTAGITVDLNLSPQTRHVVRDLTDFIKAQGIAPAAVELRTSINPIGGFAASGRSARNWNEMAADFTAMIGGIAGAGFRGPFAVADGRIIHNAGGSEAQELAFALASAVAYLRTLEAGGMTLDAAREAIYFRLSADADQFLTTVKMRAARKLWAHVEAACGLTPKPLLLTAETAWRMMTRHDAYVNMLRTTIAVAAAGFGGADAITVLPHTIALGLPDAFARRVARNMQLVLLEESNLARVADPAAGSGAVEALTNALCAATWSLFQDIEKCGGAWAALQAGFIQKHVAAVRAERQQAVARGKDAFTGTNAFPDIHEATPAVLDIAPRAAADDEPAAVMAAPLPRIRLAEPFETLRDRSDRILDRTGARPKIFLATLGNPADFNARETFARNFFAIGGIEAVSSPGPDFASVYKSLGTVLACLCSSDKVYEKEAPAALAALHTAGARHIYLAGRPGEREAELRAAGAQSFIYEGCDVLATLAAAYDILMQDG